MLNYTDKSIQPTTNEWTVEMPDEMANELEDCFAMGQIIDEIGTRYFTEEVFERLNGLKIDVFSNEHPQPHF